MPKLVVTTNVTVRFLFYLTASSPQLPYYLYIYPQKGHVGERRDRAFPLSRNRPIEMYLLPRPTGY